MVSDGIQPDVVTWNTLIDCHCKAGRHERAWEMFEEMRESGCLPCVPRLGQCICSKNDNGDRDGGKQRQMKRRGDDGSCSIDMDVEGKKLCKQSKGESFSVSKIWLWPKKGKCTSSSDVNELMVLGWDSYCITGLLENYFMAPGSKGNSANSNSTAMQLVTPTPQPHTPHPEASTRTSSVPSTATHASVAGPPPENLRRVRGPTLGKGVRRRISANSGSRLKVYVTQEMKTFCGENATKVSNELGSYIRRMCPVDGFIHSWKRIDPGLKAAMILVVRDKFSVTEDGDEFTPLVEQVFHKKGNVIYKDWKWRMTHHYNELKEKRLDAYQHPFEGVTVDGWKFMIDHIFNDHIFNDPKWQARKRAGKKNRHKVVEGFTVASRGHTLGSRSIVVAITIEADKHDRRVPDFPEKYQA